MRFFFYGTLMRGADNPVAAGLHRRLRQGARAVSRGHMFAIPDPAGWYPAFLPDKAGAAVMGLVCEVARQFSDADLARLDEYEDCRSDGAGEYRRAAVEVTSAAGDGHAVAYVYNAPLPPGAVSIADGDFSAFLAQRGLTAFR